MSTVHQEWIALTLVAAVFVRWIWRLWGRSALAALAERELKRGHVKRAMRLRKWASPARDCC